MKSPFKRIAAFLLLACASMTANAWWSQDWSYRTRINIDTGPNGVPLTQNVDRTAVLVRLHSGNITFTDLKADGSDLRFVAGDDRTPLKFHFERFDPREEVALVWVDVSQLQPGVASSMYAYYGNQQAAPAAAPATTYSSDYALVWHFGGAGQPADVTVNANNALSGPDTRELNGLIGQALRFDGTAPVALPASASLRLAEGQPLTVSAWVRSSSVSTGLIWAVPGIVQLGIDNGLAFLDVAGQRVQAATPIAADTWTHVALRADKAVITLLVDGVAMGELPRGLPAIETGSFLGGSPAGPNFTGLMDELQIARKALPVDALQLAVHSQGIGARLLTFDTAEKTEAGGHNYVGILFDALTLDAWVVIVVLGVMSLISWAVMIGKGLVISRTMSANDDFLDQYKSTIDRRAAHAGLSGPKLGKQASMSSLARLFHIGQRELAERLAENAENGLAEQGSRHAIAPQSVAAIRSALDAAHAREGQRLNRGMVLLTIAISGGPFLGLLGTVVGVMITFAGVAAAGDVNINAIAPGIAAALLATVAGLAVAIPALFGYNYLLSRVEEISTDHQIFVDELEKRIAETYRVPAGA